MIGSKIQFPDLPPPGFSINSNSRSPVYSPRGPRLLPWVNLSHTLQFIQNLANQLSGFFQDAHSDLSTLIRVPFE